MSHPVTENGRYQSQFTNAHLTIALLRFRNLITAHGNDIEVTIMKLHYSLRCTRTDAAAETVTHKS